MDFCTSADFRNAPRRYFVDEVGRRVLVGLTFDETSEFETLDNPPDNQGSTDERRWLELYGQHERAWRGWIAKASLNRNDSLLPLN